MLTIIETNDSKRYSHIVENLEKICFDSECWSLESIEAELNKENTFFILASYSNEIVGYLCASKVCDEAELNRICVLPEYRQNDIGSKLLEYLINYLRCNSCSRIMLEVRSNNINAIRLYKKFGFEIDCIRKRYYQNPTDDAVLMTFSF